MIWGRRLYRQQSGHQVRGPIGSEISLICYAAWKMEKNVLKYFTEILIIHYYNGILNVTELIVKGWTMLSTHRKIYWDLVFALFEFNRTMQWNQINFYN